MFNFLLIVGFIITALGFYIDKNTASEYSRGINKEKDPREIDYLEARISELEKTLFSHSLAIQKYRIEDKEGREEDFQDEIYEAETSKTLLSEKEKIKSKLATKGKSIAEGYEEKNNRKNESLIKYKRIRAYEDEGKNIEDICREMDMNKGEVLLLKNLYKD